MTDGEFAARARDAVKAAGGSRIEITSDPMTLAVTMEWRGKRYGMTCSRTGNSDLDDRAKELILDAVRLHGKG